MSAKLTPAQATEGPGFNSEHKDVDYSHGGKMNQTLLPEYHQLSYNCTKTSVIIIKPVSLIALTQKSTGSFICTVYKHQAKFKLC